MAYSKAQMEANHRYRAKAYDVIQVSVKKGEREKYKKQAADRGLSLNAYIINLLEGDRGTSAEVIPSPTPDEKAAD